MTLTNLNRKKLTLNENIWILSKGGEEFSGLFLGVINGKNKTFKFRNFSNGRAEIIEIEKLQKLERIVAKSSL